MKKLVSSILLLIALIACQTTPAPAPVPTPVDATWNTIATTYRGENGKRYAYICPTIAAIPVDTIWGTDTYTDDSSICLAAVHAGKVTIAGGTVTIEIKPGQASYTGSTRNGVTSSNYNVWQGSYIFI
jgi:hypothetical protein